MSAVRLFILVIAAVAAIALAFVVRGAFSTKKEPRPVAAAEAPAPSTPLVKVLVAKRDLPTGTRLTAADMGWQDWPAEGINPGFTTDGAPPAAKAEGAKKAAEDAASAATGLFGDSALKSFEGAVVREPFAANEPIVARKIVRAGEGNYMAIVLAPGSRAMSVPVTVDTAAGGFILPGDRVDLIMTRDGGDRGMITETVMRNVKVLAIDQTTQAEKEAQTMIGAVATLEIAAADSELIATTQARAKAGGTLSLALRSYADAGAPTTRGSGGSARTIRVYKAGTPTEVTITR